MGSLLSSQRRKRERFEDDDDEIFQNGKRKRIRMSDGYNNIVMQLIPTLPDEISYQIIARVPRVWYKNLKAISRTWKAAITSTEIHRVRRELGTMEEWLYVLEKNVNDILTWHALDPISGVWQKLPPMPNVENKEESRVGLSRFFMWNMVGSDLLNFWFGRKGSSNQLPFCGCAVGAADGCLYVLGGFLRGSAMSCVWKYDPCSPTQSPPLYTTPAASLIFDEGNVRRNNHRHSPRPLLQKPSSNGNQHRNELQERISKILVDGGYMRCGDGDVELTVSSRDGDFRVSVNVHRRVLAERSVFFNEKLGKGREKSKTHLTPHNARLR